MGFFNVQNVDYPWKTAVTLPLHNAYDVYANTSIGISEPILLVPPLTARMDLICLYRGVVVGMAS